MRLPVLLLTVLFTVVACDTPSEQASGSDVPTSGASSASSLPRPSATNDGPTPAPTTGHASGEPSIPNSWQTYDDNGLVLSYPQGWIIRRDEAGELIVAESASDLAPVFNVLWSPAAGGDARAVLDRATTVLSVQVDDFQAPDVDGDLETFSLPGAEDGVIAELTYVVEGPDGDEVDVRERMAGARGETQELVVRAVNQASGFEEVAETFASMLSSIQLHEMSSGGT